MTGIPRKRRFPRKPIEKPYVWKATPLGGGGLLYTTPSIWGGGGSGAGGYTGTVVIKYPEGDHISYTGGGSR